MINNNNDTDINEIKEIKEIKDIYEINEINIKDDSLITKKNATNINRNVRTKTADKNLEVYSNPENRTTMANLLKYWRMYDKRGSQLIHITLLWSIKCDVGYMFTNSDFRGNSLAPAINEGVGMKLQYEVFFVKFSHTCLLPPRFRTFCTSRGETTMTMRNVLGFEEYNDGV